MSDSENDEIDTLTKEKVMHIPMAKSGKPKSQKQIDAWKKAQSTRLQNAEKRRLEKESMIAIQHENRLLKEQLSTKSTKVKKIKKQIVVESSSEEESESESESESEPETEDDSSEEEEVVYIKKKKSKIQPKKIKKQPRIVRQNAYDNDNVDYSSYFV